MDSTAQPVWHALTPAAALEAQGVDQAAGLSAAEVATRTQRFGPNTFAAAARESRWHVFLRQYQDPMQIVLLVAGIVCLFLPGQIPTGVLLILLTLLNAWMGMNQEGKAEDSVAALQKMMVVKARVTRDGQLIEIADGRPGPGRHRQRRGGRPGARGWAHPARRDAGDRRVGAHRARAHRCPSRSRRSPPTPRSVTASTWRS